MCMFLPPKIATGIFALIASENEILDTLIQSVMQRTDSLSARLEAKGVRAALEDWFQSARLHCRRIKRGKT